MSIDELCFKKSSEIKEQLKIIKLIEDFSIKGNI